MSKINEYPQAVTINNNDLFVIDQESGGDHATKSASVSQIADKVTDGLTANDIPLTSSDTTPTATAIGDLSDLTTTDKSSLVGAVNEVNNRTPKIQYGYVNAGYCGANAVTTATINYSGFTTAPKIIACLDLVTSQINNTRDLTIAVNEDNVTTTTAEIDIINLSSALYAGFNWIAIGN